MILNTGLALVALLLAFTCCATEADAQNARCSSGVNRLQCRPVVPGGTVEESFNRRPCDFKDREVDGVCTNQDELTWGAAGTAHFSYFNADTTRPTGTNRKSARLISNVVSSQRDDIFNNRGLSELLVFFGQFIDHSTVQSPASKEKMDIEIPRNDPLFGNFTGGKLRFERTKRVAVSKTNKNVRPANILSAAVDLAGVYGANRKRSKALKVGGIGCKLKADGNFLPLNTANLVNDPVTTNEFFVAGDIRSNENPVLTALHTIFLREHNRLCDELPRSVNGEKRRFMVVRQLNIAQFQRIVFEEFYPAITGRKLPRYTGHKPTTNVGISILFSTAAFRIGHTMIGNDMKMRGPGNKRMPSLSARKTFFRKASFFKSFGPEPFIRGAAGQRAQEIDTQVMDSLRQVLFSNVPAFSAGVDLIALNLQRGRDHALPSYNTVRAFFGLSTVSSFNQVTKNGALITRLQGVYDKPNDMDLWVALLAEDHERGSSMGPTMLAIWEAEFTRLRDGDIFYYENGARRFFGELIEFNGGLRYLQSQKNLLRQIILRNTKIASADLPQPIFMV